MPLESNGQSGPSLVANRYVLLKEAVRSGGMSTVQKAFDPHESRFCAIKRMKIAHDDDRRKRESFNREQSALSDLAAHPNIVSIYEAGVDAAGYFMVLEWVPENLATFIATNGALPWDRFYSEVGRPVLEAVAFAQSRNWNHRDIKPQNILITENGHPKVADYGIARKIDKPAIGLTLREYRSEPFTPPEADAGDWSTTQDCFSWAAVAVYCLTGRVPSTYKELDELAAGLDHSAIPVSVLQLALSHIPQERPPLATALLSDLDDFAAQQSAKVQTRQTVHLQFDPGAMQRLLLAFGVGDSTEAEALVLTELNEVNVGIRRVGPDEGSRKLRFWAVGWAFEASRPVQRDLLVLVRAWPTRPAEAERQREEAYQAPLRFTFGAPKIQRADALPLDELFVNVNAFEAESANKQLHEKRERIFRVWYAFLRAKADFEARRESAIEYIGLEVDGPRATLTTDLPASADIVGQPRVIRTTTGGNVLCDILDVNLDEITVVITSGDVGKIARRGRLELNTLAAERAIYRQRQALDAVHYDRAASVRLKSIILDPSISRPPIEVALPTIGGGKFDQEKAALLKRALGLQDILAIEGPPGTGKTRLIEEILVQYLARDPDSRILLSSQTHVALDNVIERVAARQPSLDIVRIGRLDDPKISSACREFVLDHKAIAWSARVRSRAQGFMAKWASNRQIDRTSIEVGMLAERLNLLRHRELEIQTALAEATQGLRDIEARAETKLAETGSAASPQLASASVQAQEAAGALRNELRRTKHDISSVREKMTSAGGYAQELATTESGAELSDWSRMLLGDGEDHTKCRELLELQEQWLLRVGRSSDFHAAMLASAQIVAGTCIGMAGVPGMRDVVYDLCIIDEASKATATEILVPMSRSRKWIVVGDPKQLPPFFEDESITNIDDFDVTEVRHTLLDRLLAGLPDHSHAELTNQHRMVKPIGDLISEAFYDGRLNSPNTIADVKLPGAFPKAVTWLSTTDARDAREIRHGSSFYNDGECRIVRDALSQINFLANKAKNQYEIALIAGYVSQVKALQDAIRDRLHEWTSLRITCSTVDAFQGSEADVCIYSVTRSNEKASLGFLREKPRLNVALSRGRSSLIIVGDDVFCRSIEGANPFRKVLDFIDAHDGDCERRPVR
ncbi:hypothetical protein BH11PSE3_BH11PSE3_12440 [soil metagenome]